PTIYIPARRIDPETVEIGRAIENNAFTPGVQLPLKTIEAGRQVILRDSAGEPTPAEVTSVAAIGLDVTFNTTPEDLTTALELRLDTEQSQQLTGLRSSILPATFTLTSGEPELSVTIGALPPRTIKLSSTPTNPSTAATQLQASLTASLPLTPEFAQCRVTHTENTLIVLTGVPGLPITFALPPPIPRPPANWAWSRRARSGSMCSSRATSPGPPSSPTPCGNFRLPSAPSDPAQ